jgi:hypothetical protein
MNPNTVNFLKKTRHTRYLKIFDMDSLYIHQLAEATQTTYDQLQHYVRLFDADSSLTEIPQHGIGKNIAPAEALFLSLDRYARAAIKELATRLAKLLRELRDMVYSNLSNKHQSSHTHPMYRTLDGFADLQLSKVHGCSGPPCSCLKKFPHFIDSNFVGNQVAVETLEHLKVVILTAGFRSSSIYVPGHKIEAFVHADIFHVGITMDSVLSGINVVFDTGDWYPFGKNEEDPIPSEKVGNWNKAADGLRSITHHESTFTQPEDGDKRPRMVTLELDDEMSLEELSNLVGTFGPAFKELHKKGFRMRFIH